MPFYGGYSSNKLPASGYDTRYANDLSNKIPASGYGTQYANNQYNQYTPAKYDTGSVLGASSDSDQSSQKSSSNKSSGNDRGSVSVKIDGVKFDSESEFKKAKKELDSLYGGTLDFINKQRNALQDAKGNFLKTYSAPYESQVPLIEQARDQGLNAIKGGIEGIQQTGRSALDDARNLYNELSTRNQQAFGGGALSSAGQASSEILNREQMRQTGDIRQGITTQVARLEQQGRDLEQETNAKLQSIEQRKQAALAQAEIEFMNRMQEINRMEAETRQNKSLAKLDFLREFRSRVADTQAQARAFQQQVALMHEQARINLANEYNATLASSQQAYDLSTGAMGEMGNTAGTAMDDLYGNNALSSGQEQSYYPTQGLSGSIKSQGDRVEDIYA